MDELEGDEAPEFEAAIERDLEDRKVSESRDSVHIEEQVTDRTRRLRHHLQHKCRDIRDDDPCGHRHGPRPSSAAASTEHIVSVVDAHEHPSEVE